MGKYRPLHQRLLGSAAVVELTFGEIDALIGGLPASARHHRTWWGNAAGGAHPQAQAWLSAGVVVDEVSLEAERVRFRRSGTPQPTSGVTPQEPAQQELLVGGSVPLAPALAALASARPVFHSEADFQHALAWQLKLADSSLHVRLETRPLPGMRLDLQVSSADWTRTTAIELKYLTSAWSGEVDGEPFAIKSQGAQDISGYDVVKDVWRVEQMLAAKPAWDGAVVVLSNDSYYWRPPSQARATNAAAFRLHEGTVLSGTRAWGPLTGSGTRASREADLVLRGAYPLHWRDYATLPSGGANATFRWLMVVPEAPRAEPHTT